MSHSLRRLNLANIIMVASEKQDMHVVYYMVERLRKESVEMRKTIRL